MNTGLDPATLAVGTGLIANGLTAVVSRVAQRMLVQHDPVGARAIARVKARSTQSPAETQTRIGRIAAAKLARTAVVDKVSDTDRLKMFLVSPEVESIIRQIFAAELLGKSSTIADIRGRFEALLQLHVRSSPQQRATLNKVLFPALVEAIQETLAVEVELGSLAAHDARDELRIRVLRDELDAVKKSIVALRKQNQASVKAILAFESKYRDAVKGRHSYIVPPHLNEAQKIHIDDLYVSPRFIGAARSKGEEQRSIDMAQLLTSTHRGVILGNPGGGKSTFAAKVCYDLSSARADEELNGDQLTPILVVLREYAADNKDRKVSILQFVEEVANSTYQLEPPSSALDYLLLNGRALIIFDGLDELLETNQRQKVTADVESFCRLYPSARVLVTSREVGV